MTSWRGTGTLRLYEQNKVIAEEKAFSGGVEGKGPIPEGTYKMSITQADTPTGMEDLVPYGRDDSGNLQYGLAPSWKLQDIPDDIAGVHGAQTEWGTKRVRLVPDPGQEGSAFRGNYIHGKRRQGDYTHGCICDRKEGVLNKLFGLDPKKVPRVPVQVNPAPPVERK